jgi:hypothetical protein
MRVSGQQAISEKRASNGVKRARLAKPKGRSKVTNSRGLLPGAPHRDVWSRRFRDLTALHVSDLGSDITSSEEAILRRCICLQIELERREVLFATNGGATDGQLQIYQQTSNSLRRLLESLGLKRRTKDANDLTLDQYLASEERAEAAE